jgi:hypothetical protein
MTHQSKAFLQKSQESVRIRKTVSVKGLKPFSTFPIGRRKAAKKPIAYLFTKPLDAQANK